MPSADDFAGAPNPMAGTLAEGVKTISIEQEIGFVKYERKILPLDGYVFWLKTAEKITQKGSLHYETDTRQESEEVYTANRVVFTSLDEVNDLNDIDPDEMYIGEFEGMKFAFSTRGSFYRQAKLFHYIGFAVYPDMLPQLIDNPNQLNPARVIVSNSLPLWLSLNGKSSKEFANPIALFPAFLSPTNQPPPYATVDVRDETTEALMSAPLILKDKSHVQLATERVKVTFWGLRNDQAQTFIDFILQYALDYEPFGIMNSPIIRDEKRTQAELVTLGMKKSAEFVISYYQYAARNVARQLITQASSSFIVRDP